MGKLVPLPTVLSKSQTLYMLYIYIIYIYYIYVYKDMQISTFFPQQHTQQDLIILDSFECMACLGAAVAQSLDYAIFQLAISA